MYLKQQLASAVSIREALKLCTHYLAEHNIGEAKENAELLFLHISGWNRAALLMNMMDRLDEEWLEAYSQAIERKAKGEPLQYITGEQYFFGRRFIVNEHVLIPRPETELLVEAIIASIRTSYGDKPLTVLDVGTGSGAIALSLKGELPQLNVVASDISPHALKVAKANAALHQLDVSFVEGDLLQPFVNGEALRYGEQDIDVVVSNPPYIPDDEKDSLQVEVQCYEPHLALFGGKDGLTPYRIMLETIKALNYKPVIIGFELGIHQPAVIATHMQQQGYWSEVNIITDYNGIDRHIIAKK